MRPLAAPGNQDIEFTFFEIKKIQAVFENIDINELKKSGLKAKIDAVIMNPPFGTKQKHADTEFLLKAFELTDKI